MICSKLTHQCIAQHASEKRLATAGNAHRASQLVSVQSIRDFGAQPSMGCLYHTSPLKVQGGGEERIKSQISRKQCFPQQGRCTHAFTSVITLYTRPAKPQARQKPSMMEMVGMKPPLVEELLDLITTARGKVSWLQWCDTWCINHTSGQAPH